MSDVRLLHGDCIEVMADLDADTYADLDDRGRL